MLERVAVHQTRLRTPGLGLDAKGVALGGKGLVLLPSLDRLVAFLALYTRGGSLEDILRTLVVEVVESKLGAREVTITFAAESSDRMDRVSEVARLAGGFTFTGTSRHFVQYRDAGAPFGYDIGEISAGEGSLALYHGSFTQSYEADRKIDVSSLLLRLEPHLDPSTLHEPGPRWLCAEHGLGPALISYLVRSNVDAEVGVAEWPPESSFDETNVRRFLFRLPEVPERMVPLLTSTPGLVSFLPVADGAAVQVGYRHPVNLRACPIFPPQGLVLFRGGGQDVLQLERVPALGDVRAFARVQLRNGDSKSALSEVNERPDEVSLSLRLFPSMESWRSITATRVAEAEYPILRRVAYALGTATLRKAQVAFAGGSAYVRHPDGIEAVPVGEFFREVHPGLFIPAGYDAVPAVAPEVLFRALGAPPDYTLFVGRDAAAVGVPSSAFVSLETALLEAQDWAPLAAEEISSGLATEIPEVSLTDLGIRPMRDVEPPEDVEEEA